MKVFISHSFEDEQYVQKIAETLKDQGIDVWYDEWSIGVGDSLVSKIEAGIVDSNVLLIILSKASSKSSWVRAELNAFFNKAMSDRSIRLVPVLLENVEVPPLLRDRVYVDLRKDFEGGLVTLMQHLQPEIDPCAVLIDDVQIDNFNSGMLRPNMLGGLTVVYHENGDPLSLRALFLYHDRGKSLGLTFDFGSHSNHPVPPQFVGYATRLQFANWNQFVECGYWLCFEACSDGNAQVMGLEIKRLSSPPKEDTREEIAKWQIDLSIEWEMKSLRLSDIGFPNAVWNNLWEICFVFNRDNVAGDRGLVQIDNLHLSRIPKV